MIRWVICPLVRVQRTDSETGETIEYRAPKVATLIDPARGKPYQFAATVAGGWALCKVRAGDAGPLDADPLVIDLLEADQDAGYDAPELLQKTPADLGWTAAQEQRLRQLWQLVGVPVGALPGRYTVGDVLAGLARAIGAPDNVDQIKA